MVAYRSRKLAGQWVENDMDGDGFQVSQEFTEMLFRPVFAHFRQHKEAMFGAYVSGKLEYEYFRKNG